MMEWELKKDRTGVRYVHVLDNYLCTYTHARTGLSPITEWAQAYSPNDMHCVYLAFFLIFSYINILIQAQGSTCTATCCGKGFL